MNTAGGKLLIQLSQLQTRVEPGNFRFLFDLIDQFSGIAASQVDVEKDALPFVSQAAQTVGLKLIYCLNESTVLGLLADFEGRDQKTEVEQELGTVFKALHTEQRRYDFLSLLVCSTLACMANHVLSIYPDELASWSMIIQVVDHFPALARLSAGCDCEALRRCWGERSEETVRSWKTDGYELILLRQAFRNARFDALGHWIQTFQNPGANAVPLLEKCINKLRMALGFLLTVETPNWRIAPFSELREGASLPAILRELCSRSLKPVPLDSPLYEPIWAPALRNVSAGPESRLYFLSVGTLRRKRYLVELADIACLTQQPVLSTRREWELDPLEFTRKNIDKIPVSNAVQILGRSIDEVERALLDARIAATGQRLQAMMSPVLEDVTPEALAIFLVEQLKITPFATPIFTYFLRRLHRLLTKTKNNAA